ncbi:MAG: hypothetical protein AB7Q29_14520 [Vicinamibacterales bacterium]
MADVASDVDEVELEPEKRWPGVAQAYDFVAPSYQQAVTRFEAADARLGLVLDRISTLTLAAPVFAKALRPEIAFGSYPFIVAMACAVAGAAIAITGRFTGRLTLVDPTILYEKALHLSEWEFKKNQVFFAGENFRANRLAIERKHELAIRASVALVLEVTAFVFWLVV